MSYSAEKTRAANDELEKKIIKDRSDWGGKIQDLVQLIKSMNSLSECQVYMLSYRQTLLDKVSDFKTNIYKRNAVWERHFKSKWREYSLNYDLKLTNGEKTQFIKADLSDLKTQISLLESHVDYYLECIRTLDNMAFAIRNRIRLDDDE